MYLSHERRTLTLIGQAAPTPTFVVSSVTPAQTTLPVETAIQTVFDHSFVSPAPIPTDTAGASSKSADGGSKKVNPGPIAGGVIGGVILIALIAVGVWFFLRRRRAKEMDSMARGITPMLGSNGSAKFAMDNSPEMGEERRSRSALSGGGVFGPFGGYYRTPTVPDVGNREVSQPVDIDRPRDAGQSMDIVPAYNMDDEPPEDMYISSNEKVGLQPPPVEAHPAYHPLPGQSRSIPTYYPGGTHPDHPPYTLKNLPSQRDNHPTTVALPGQSTVGRSPELPDLLFSPIDLVRGAEHLDIIPITPQAELAAFPSPPTSIPSAAKSSDKKSILRRSITPPSRSHRPQRPRRQSTPPRHSAPLDRLTPAYNPEVSPSPAPKTDDAQAPSKSMTQKGLHISGMGQKAEKTPATRPSFRPRFQTYPSPTAGGRPELPASFPPPKKMPAFNHISLPSPIPTTPVQKASPVPSIARNESTGTSSTYSIPIGLASTLARQNSLNNWPLHNHPVTSDAHHLRNQSSAVSALSAMRDVQNASEVSALSVVPSTNLKHNHSRDLSAHSEHAHVMSWQDYDDEINDIGDASEISPMFSPASATASAMDRRQNSIVSPMTAIGRTPHAGGSTFSGLIGARTPSQLRGAKTPSQQSLWERERERQEYFGDLSVQPLSMGKRWGEGLRKKTLRGGQKKRIPSEQLLNGGANY